MADKTARGRFVWHELITPDASSAHSFYTKALGWKTQPWEADPTYTMFVAPSGPLGGSVGRPSEQPHWITYIGTDHIEGTVDQARSLGARVVRDITEMQNGGKYALLEDPQGAAFGVYVSPHETAPEREPKVGEYSWHELATTDYQAAFKFYSALFGWEPAGQHDMGGPVGVYFMFGRGGNPIGGIFKRTADMPGGPSWLGYVRVKDVQQTVKKAKSAGGTLIMGPMEVPGGDWVAQFTDPQGGVFAVHTVVADVKRAAGAGAGESAAAPTAAATQPSESKEDQAAATGAARKTAAKAAAKKGKAPAKKVAPAKKAAKPAKKAAKKGGRKATKKKATKKRGAAARGAKRPARKTAKAKKTTKARAGAKKKAGKRARKAK